MEQQLLSQAPPHAVGYRLVLAPRPEDELPRLSPPIGIDGTLSCWRLRPFQAPNDWRLVDGVLYRVLWVFGTGEVIPPKDERTLPSLHFHLSRCVPEEQPAEATESVVLRTPSSEKAIPPSTPTAPDTSTDTREETRGSEPELRPEVEQRLDEEDSVKDSVSEELAHPVVSVVQEDPIEEIQLAEDLRELAQTLSMACHDHWYWQQQEHARRRYSVTMAAGLVDKAFVLARNLHDGIVGRPIQFLCISARCFGLLKSWLSDLLRALCQQGRGKEALDLYDSFCETLGKGAADGIALRLEVLQQVDQPAEAMRFAQQFLDREDADVNTLMLCTQIFRRCGNLQIAERAARQQYQRALHSYDAEDLREAAESLHAILSELGKREEATRLTKLFGERGELHVRSVYETHPETERSGSPFGATSVQSASPILQTEPVPKKPIVAAPKIGRNAPCLCGSGKKHKKCCGLHPTAAGTQGE